MKYRIEHIRWIEGQGISYNETIDNVDDVMSVDELKKIYGDFLIDDDWIELKDNDTDEIIVTTMWQ